MRVRFSIMPRYTLETIIIVLVILALTQHSCYMYRLAIIGVQTCNHARWPTNN